MAVTPHWSRAGLSVVHRDRNSGVHVSALQLLRMARSMSVRSNGVMPVILPAGTDNGWTLTEIATDHGLFG
ncbi:hypothetical protein [Streptomyces olivaceiscleroticus]|uniref:Uncharacterized protein n=1 Tax=Streptomyces olivaceiscleroticus TaxID=68245 RepID=A0ABN1A2X8_9ACTN